MAYIFSDDFRPILILSAVAKTHYPEQLEIYLEPMNILVDQEAGFRKKHFTQISLINITKHAMAHAVLSSYSYLHFY